MVNVIVAVPAVDVANTVVDVPGPAFTVATPVLLLLHVPEPVASLSVVVWLTQRLAVPVMGTMGFTETTCVI
jgi:hypothetical protein